MKGVGEQIPHGKHWKHHKLSQGLHQMIQATAVYVPELLASPDASLISYVVLVLSDLIYCIHGGCTYLTQCSPNNIDIQM